MGGQNFIVAVIGDGALTGGMAFEALNDAGRSHNDLIVILNDNEMSIAQNVGGLSHYLNKVRTQPFYFKVKEDLGSIINRIPGIGKNAIRALDKVKGSIKYMIMPGVVFEEIGFTYVGPVDGHNLNELIDILTKSKAFKGPVLIHICTQKGKGYIHAENNPHVYHGISAFEIRSGTEILRKKRDYSLVFGDKLVEMALSNQKIVAITAAMQHGTGLNIFGEKFPQRLFDVAIAEQHAVTFAAGLAKGGLIPVVAIYSTFLQRAYDQILHDVALQNLHVIFAIDRAGIVGEDGETHQGIYDLSFLRHIPNVTIMACSNYVELNMMLEYAAFEHSGPIAIRYPRGVGSSKSFIDKEPKIVFGQGVLLEKGNDITIIAEGSIVEQVLSLHEMLKRLNVSAEVINPRFIKPLPEQMIEESVIKTGKIITIENNVAIGGLGSAVLELLSKKGLNVPNRIFGFPDIPIPHGNISELFNAYHMDSQSILSNIMTMMKDS